MNAFPGLTWEFSERAKSIAFMDMTISINNSNKIETTLFEKRLNLHLYIPAHSVHPPGLLPGIVYGTLFRIITLCSDEDDQLQRTKVFFKRLIACGYKGNNIRTLFYKAITHARAYNTMNKGFFQRLIARGYKGNDIRTLFHKAITRAKAYNGPATAEDDDHNSVILHLPFHPNNPASSRIQAAWQTHVAKPQWKLPLEHMKNQKNKKKMQHQTDDYRIQTPHEPR